MHKLMLDFDETHPFQPKRRSHSSTKAVLEWVRTRSQNTNKTAGEKSIDLSSNFDKSSRTGQFVKIPISKEYSTIRNISEDYSSSNNETDSKSSYLRHANKYVPVIGSSTQKNSEKTQKLLELYRKNKFSTGII
jgi:hypothetical protein